ncbi:MAG: twin-arginine translocase TatA/TatE family subunit [Microscillaceae bacterium]|nr:twin-arginine translocase TatA/TatE family subunit [Microscillaceae bacterium]
MHLSSLFLFFNLGGPEIFLIFLALLLLFGAKKIPELARGLGRGIREFKDATREVKDQIEDGIRDEDEKRKTKAN